jgi:hypothetical protein
MHALMAERSDVETLWHITKALGVTLKTFFDEEKPRRRVSREKN